MKPKFRKRYVLGEGYPWGMGTVAIKSVSISSISPGLSFKNLAWPDELWKRELPIYRLELVRVDGKK